MEKSMLLNNPFNAQNRQYIEEYCCALSLIRAVSNYLNLYRSEEERTLESALKLLCASNADESSFRPLSHFDMIFKEVAAKDPDSFALKQYYLFNRFSPELRNKIFLVVQAYNESDEEMISNKVETRHKNLSEMKVIQKESDETKKRCR